MAKKEFIVRFYKDANDAWCGSAYFVNDALGKKHIFSAAATPMGKKTTSVGWIKERLDDYENKIRNRHCGWRRVTEEGYDNFCAK